jgi:hypothetical protein
MKLKYRVETAEPLASAYWLRLRRSRHQRNNSPTRGCPGAAACIVCAAATPKG